MSNEVINWALAKKIEHNAPRKFILVLLANRANDAWECWPGEKLLSEESGISRVQVGKHLQALEDDGLILRVPWQRDDGGQGANGYILGDEPKLTPYSFTRRGGGRIRVGGFSPTRTGPTRTRGAKNPQEKPTGKPSVSAAREESRRRSSAKAADDSMDHQTPVPLPTSHDFFEAIRAMRDQKPDCYASGIEEIKSRASKLWRDAVEKAIKQYKESEPDSVKDQSAVDFLAYQYAMVIRHPNWPAWLIGPLLPYLDATKAGSA